MITELTEDQQRQWLIFELLIWVFVMVLVTRSQWNKKLPSVGLPLMYLFSFSMIHFFGALIYALPWYKPHHGYLISIHSSLATTAIGFQQSIYGIVAFGIGSTIFVPCLIKIINLPWLRDFPRQPNLNLFKIYICIGILFVLLFPYLSKIPSVGALAYSGISLFLAGLCLAYWQFWYMGNRLAFLLSLIFTCSLPIFTLVTMGFMSFGTNAAMLVLLFLYNFYRPRWKIIIIGFLVIYFGLSVFANYLRDRDSIRGTQDNSRIEKIFNTVGKFELFDIHNQAHLESIDIRLNQNVFVGLAVNQLSSGIVDYAGGKTIEQAILSSFPRILWPNKPAVSGSGNLVSQYTGLKIAEGSSFGVGQVLEFYLNFGSWGVFFGFLVFGIVLRVIDMTAGYKLLIGNWVGFTSWFVPGMSLLGTGLSLVDVVQSLSSSVVLVYLINGIYLQRIGRRQTSKTEVNSYYDHL